MSPLLYLCIVTLMRTYGNGSMDFRLDTTYLGRIPDILSIPYEFNDQHILPIKKMLITKIRLLTLVLHHRRDLEWGYFFGLHTGIMLCLKQGCLMFPPPGFCAVWEETYGGGGIILQTQHHHFIKSLKLNSTTEHHPPP